MGKIEFSWEMIHKEILCEFRPDFVELEANDFMKMMIPKEMFDNLFIQNDLYQRELVEAVYFGKAEDETALNGIHQKVAVWIIEQKKPKGGAHTYDTCPTLQEFRQKWEEILPFTKNNAGAPEMEEERNRIELKTLIVDKMYEISPELVDIGKALDLLVVQKKYSSALAILSIMATAPSAFEGTNPKICKIVLPILSDNDKDRAFNLLCDSETRITWEMLHEQVFKRLNADRHLAERKRFLEELVPEELLKKLRESDGKDKQAKKREETNTDNKIAKNARGDKYLGYVYLGKTGAKPRFIAARDYIIGQRSMCEEPYTWGNSPVVSHFRAKWEELIPATRYTAPECNNTDEPDAPKMKTVVDSLLSTIPLDRQNVVLRLEGILQEQSYSMVLAILSVIACTLFCFNAEFGNDTDNRILYNVVLPPLPEKEETSPSLVKGRKMLDDSGKSLADLEAALKQALMDPLEKGEAYFLLYTKAIRIGNNSLAGEYLRKANNAGYLPAIQKYSENDAQKWLNEARAIFNGPRGINSGYMDTHCCTKCEDILRIATHISRDYCAEASYMLYKCIAADKYHPTTGETAEYYLELSHMYGYENATEEWKSRNISTIAPQPERSVCRTEGMCCCNANNIYAATFEKTIPYTWGGALVPYDLKALDQDCFNSITRRFLFISDNFSENLSDLFRTLQLIKNHKPRPESINWEFYVRHDSESVHVLVDTALSRLSEYRIPVYILNDSKIAAQQLLSRHPLFYPVRAMKLDKMEQTGAKRPLLHFVLVGNSPVTEWLVREAFWMMGFRNNVIRSRITVIAENGEDFEKTLKGRFPGMSNKITEIEKIELPEIKGENVPLESAELQNKIRKFTEETDYCYFAVAADSDEGNLTLATRIREALIRTAVNSQKAEKLHQMPPVAFLCRNEEIAWLSKGMVIEKGKYGNAWFNTRALIPFGEVSIRYHFDNINGGTFDSLAKCIHFQYNQLTPEAVHSGSPEALEVEKDYYLRQYNQDSSYCMALGMPYRLFQLEDRNNAQLMPIGWSILQSASYVSVNQLHFMAVRMKSLNDAEIRTIAEWEHARWTRWMLSRGWCGATIEEAVFAYHSGNPRQQLFACKMHSCICGYDAQKNLANELETQCGLNKDFYSYDYNNVKATGQLLNLEWVVDRTKEAKGKTAGKEK